MEEIAQTENGSVTFGESTTPSASFTISRNGDLVHKMYLQMDIGNIVSGTSTKTSIFHNLINEIECEIGGQKIDRQFGHWLETWTSLTVPNDRGTRPKSSGNDGSPDDGIPIAASFDDTNSGISGGSMNISLYDKMTGNVECNGELASGDIDYKKIHIPLQFWFNRNPGLALPLIALQYHEVKIKISFNSLTEAFGGANNTGPTETKLYTQYIYLDTDERRRFAQVSHEYLIEQLQFQRETGSAASPPRNITLNFNHPVKELIWVSNNASNVPTASALTTTWQLKLNGHDRFSARPLQYFTKQQVYDYHTGYGGLGAAGKDTIAVYSFALKPEEHQPSGTCNFSRIDTAQLQDTSGTQDVANLNVYAVNYNVLRIMSGMGGLAYSN
tara:strand:- start:944 stop:2101 length:1158 start_codon:yes stop_codon:yes gene_type:complete